MGDRRALLFGAAGSREAWRFPRQESGRGFLYHTISSSPATLTTAAAIIRHRHQMEKSWAAAPAPRSPP